MKTTGNIISQIKRASDILFIYSFVAPEDFKYNKINKDRSVTVVEVKKGDVVESLYYVSDPSYKPLSLTLNVTLRDNLQLSASEPVMTEFDFIASVEEAKTKGKLKANPKALESEVEK